MNNFLNHYIDLLTLGLTLLIVIWVSVIAWKRSRKTTRLGLLMLLFLGPVLVMTTMFSHLFEITFHAFDSNFTGKFGLRFRFYSLVMLGLVLGNAGVYFFLGARAFALSADLRPVKVLRPAGTVALITFPLLWITPLAFIVMAVCGISIGAAFLVHKKPALSAMPIELARA